MVTPAKKQLTQKNIRMSSTIVMTRPLFVCRNLPHLGCRATPARRFERLKGAAPTLAPAAFHTASSRHRTRRAMPRTPRLLSTIFSLLLLGSLCVLGNSSAEARPAKNTPVASPPKQAPVRTDLTPRDTNDCLAVARTLNEQVKKLARQTRRGIPPEFTRVASDLNQSCGAEDFKKAWISIEWLNGCLNNFTKDAELGFCSRNEGYSCAINARSDGCVQRR
jgi:hypothetical protein